MGFARSLGQGIKAEPQTQIKQKHRGLAYRQVRGSDGVKSQWREAAIAAVNGLLIRGARNIRRNVWNLFVFVASLVLRRQER
jgi:hypothetical protein